jgi:hypothetical protein
MSNKKQIAVEWLVSNISSKIDNEYWCNQKEITEWVEQAKAIEKEQIIDALQSGNNYLLVMPIDILEQYYKETYEK